MPAAVQIEESQPERNATSIHPLETKPAKYAPRGNIPNTPFAISTISFILGVVFSFGVLVSSTRGFNVHWWTTPQLGFFIAAWSGFHWAEFAVTAGWNLEKCSVDSFLLENGAAYHLANTAALLEYLITLYFEPALKTYTKTSAMGMAMVVFGQGLRSAAMIHASTNFSHTVAFRKRPSHRLVTDGVYAWFRHPSYAGFFYWALGTQLVLQNPIAFVIYFILLWRFFYYRIKVEESTLARFFGDDYVKYKNRVGTKIPFIR